MALEAKKSYSRPSASYRTREARSIAQSESEGLGMRKAASGSPLSPQAWWWGDAGTNPGIQRLENLEF